VEEILCNIVLQGEYSSQLVNARGRGFYCAVDARDTAHRDKLVTALRQKGLLTYLLAFLLTYLLLTYLLTHSLTHSLTYLLTYLLSFHFAIGA